MEIDDSHRADLLRLAAERGEKDFSSIIREALDAYMITHRNREGFVDAAFAQRGSFNEDDADALEASVRELRDNWR